MIAEVSSYRSPVDIPNGFLDCGEERLDASFDCSLPTFGRRSIRCSLALRVIRCVCGRISVVVAPVSGKVVQICSMGRT